MAKPKGGLGRGLNALLGGAGTEAASDPTARARIVVEKDDEPTRSHEVPSTDKEDSAGVSAGQAVEEFPEYGLAGENVTIKEVKSREVHERPVLETIVVEEEEPVQQDDEAVEQEDSPVSEPGDFTVEISCVIPNPDQPRTNFKKEELDELAESLRQNGFLQPILVRRIDDARYQIIAGERRYQASLLIGLERVPVRLVEADDDKALELALVENIQRADLNPIEEAYGYRRMMEHGNLTQAEVAQVVSKGRSTIANALRLLELPEQAQQLLFEEKITAGHARAILSIPDEQGRLKLTEKLMEERLSVRDAETLARLLSGKAVTAPSPRVPTPKSFKSVARSLRNALHTNVRVKTVKGKNKIEIEFADEDELQRLFKQLIPGQSAE
ncbi:ParB/RepB/Spo0J family partition protein [Berryella wangjianweii]|uniref:ParB/RepB/Spo0J family partition protein n=1 Tax=Berryella wangjianweii TaxID=2734634 RepID=UPI0028F6CFE7|nr:ParB/RepB/Spo0J family partition protein [Berryella wangjianweii]